jgi:hypothetical protein
MENYLIIGSFFLVYGIRFSKDIMYVYIFDDNHLFEVPMEMFTIIDDIISDKWKIKVWKDGDVTLWPELFYENDFLENFAEHEITERNLFKELRAEIEKPPVKHCSQPLPIQTAMKAQWRMTSFGLNDLADDPEHDKRG